MKKLDALWFRFFSEATINTKDRWVRYVVWLIIVFPMIIGVIINASHHFRGGLGWVLVGTGLLVVFGIIWIAVFFYHNWRIKHGI